MDTKLHTPTPWFAKRWGFSTVYIESRIRPGVLQEVAACGPAEGGSEEQDANAAFIVRAANSHAVLAEYFHASKSLQMTMGHPDATVEDKHKAEARYKAATTAARAALAAAEG